MQENGGDKVDDIGGEVYHSLCSLRSASEVLRELGYTSIRETCIECFKVIDPQVKSPSCASCHKGCHAECLERLNSRLYRRRTAIQQLECEWCIDFNRCVQCKNALDADDTNTYSCSICHRKTHHRCHAVPRSIMEAAAGEKRFVNLKQYIVCGGCLSRFGIREVVDWQTHGSKEYCLVRTDHPSPAHLTWVEEKLLNPSLKSSEGLLVSSPPEVEGIFSMHVPAQHLDLTIDRVEQLLAEYQFIAKGRGFLFLTKWRHGLGGLVWQQARIFQQQRHHISKFLHQLRMSLLSMHHELPPPLLERYFAHCITNYTQLNRIDLNSRPTPKTEGSNGQSVRAQHIYQIYSRKCKQFVNIKHTGEKVEAMCQLIRTIYFIDKCPLPVIILTDQTKLNAWTATTLKQLPYLTVLSLESAHAGVEEVVSHRLLTKHGNGRLFRFNVLIMPYQTLRAIGSLFDFRNALQGFSLMVMDEKMPPLARYYYTNVKIARIKFHKDQKPQALITAPTDKHEVTSSDITSSQKKSSMTLSSSRNLKLFLERCSIEGQRAQPRSFIDILYQEFCESFHLSQAALIDRLPNQLQRLIFLRFVMTFGLNSFKKEDIYERMMKLEPSCFIQPKEAALTKLQTYVGYFLVHAAKHKGYITPEIKQFFFFAIERKHVFKVINDHIRLKHFCQLFEKDPHLQLILSPPKILVQKQEVTLWRWESRFDYYICQGVVSFGSGNWEAISENKGSWKNKGETIPLRSYICQALAITTFRLSFFCDFLKARFQVILTALEKRFG